MHPSYYYGAHACMAQRPGAAPRRTAVAAGGGQLIVPRHVSIVSRRQADVPLDAVTRY
jgi:hypothetical protein